jgi:hypothetical protein
VLSFDTTELNAKQLAPTGNFYSGGSVIAEKLLYVPFESTTTIESALESFGVLATNSTEGVNLDVRRRLEATFKAGESRILFRIAPAGSYDVNTNANFKCGGFNLFVSYYAE